MGGAQPPFTTTEAAHTALHLRILLLRAGDVEVNPGLSAPGEPVPSALNPIQSSAPNASVSCTGTATAWLEINKWVPRATFTFTLAAAQMSPPSKIFIYLASQSPSPLTIRPLNVITTILAVTQNGLSMLFLVPSAIYNTRDRVITLELAWMDTKVTSDSMPLVRLKRWTISFYMII